MRMRRRRRRYARFATLDLWADLGPGAPGFRLRPGRTGFDPWEMYMEYARMLGLLLRAAFTGRLGPYPVASLVLLLAFLTFYLPDVVAWAIVTFLFPTYLTADLLFSGIYLSILLVLLLVLVRFVIRRRRIHP